MKIICAVSHNTPENLAFSGIFMLHMILSVFDKYVSSNWCKEIVAFYFCLIQETLQIIVFFTVLKWHEIYRRYYGNCKCTTSLSNPLFWPFQIKKDNSYLIYGNTLHCHQKIKEQSSIYQKNDTVVEKTLVRSVISKWKNPYFFV